MQITAKSYFSGAGGMDLGIEESGINIIESYEIDKKCCDTLRKNFKHHVNESDITQITVLDQNDADVYIGTFQIMRKVFSNVTTNEIVGAYSHPVIINL